MTAKQEIQKILLSDFWTFVRWMDIRDESNKDKVLIPDIRLYQELSASIQSSKPTLILLPRKFRKSLLVSQLYSIWFMLRYPNRTIAILTATYDLVTNITTGIKNFYNRHDKLKTIFGHDLLTKATDKEVIIKYRTTTRKEPNLKAYSMDSASFAGFRCDLLIYDDIINDNWRTATKTVKDKWTNTFYASMQMLEQDGIMKYLGTRFGHDDIAGQLLSKHEDDWEIYIESVLDDDGNVKHPEVMDREEIERNKRSLPAHIFSSQYLNHPIVAANSLFNIDDYTRYDQLPTAFKRVIFGMDIAVMKSKDKGDFSTIVAVGQDNKHNLYILDGVDTREGIEDLFSKLVIMCNKWKPSQIYVEAISGFQFAYDYIHTESKKNQMYLPLNAITTQKDNKNIRLETLEPIFRSGDLLIPPEHTIRNNKGLEKLIYEEMTYFDRLKSDNRDDMLDALEMAVRYLKKKDDIGFISKTWNSPAKF